MLPPMLDLALTVATGRGHRNGLARAARRAVGVRADGRSSPRPRRGAAPAAGLCAAAPAGHGRFRELRAQLLDHLGADRRRDLVRARSALRRTTRDDARLATRLSPHVAGRRVARATRLELSDG